VQAFRRLTAVEEFFLHLWDELDDLSGLCRHVATEMAAELASAATPLIAALTALLAGTGTTLLLLHRSLRPLLG
jgi:hypothetical protein